MTGGERLALKARAIERHLARVEGSLPASPELLQRLVRTGRSPGGGEPA